MCSLEIYYIVNSFKMNNKLSKSQTNNLVECYRRVMNFKKGNENDTMVLLNYPRLVKGSNNLFIPYSKEQNKCLQWYSLTENGKKLINELKTLITWNEQTNMKLISYNH